MRRFWNRREKAESKKEIIFKCENTLSWFSDVKTHIIIRFSHSKLTTADKFRIRLYSFVETSQTWFHSEIIPFTHWKIGPKSSSKINLCPLQNSPFDRLGASGEKFIRYESYESYDMMQLLTRFFDVSWNSILYQIWFTAEIFVNSVKPWCYQVFYNL